MAKETSRDKIDLNDVEMVFGTPTSPSSQRKPDVHSVASERSNGKSGLKSDRADGDAEALPTAAQPLLEPERPRQRPPLAGPEIDDIEDGDQVKSGASDAGSKPSSQHEGIDDGLLEGTEKHDVTNTGEADGEGAESDAAGAGALDHSKTNGDGAHEHDDGKWSSHDLDETDFYYGDGYMGNGLHNRLGEDRPGSPFPQSIPDVNTYQQKKNLAQGMMDLALLSANANQLRYVLESQQSHPYYFPSLVFISCSIILQIAVGVGLILNSRYNVKDEKDICKADKINNMTVLGIFLITIVNVFITSFSVATPAATAAIQQAGVLAGTG